MYVIQHCFIFRPLDSTVSVDAGIEPRTVATLVLTARRSNHLARSWLDLFHNWLDLIHKLILAPSLTSPEALYLLHCEKERLEKRVGWMKFWLLGE
jgi:hypothetical protein